MNKDFYSFSFNEIKARHALEIAHELHFASAVLDPGDTETRDKLRQAIVSFKLNRTEDNLINLNSIGSTIRQKLNL